MHLPLAAILCLLPALAAQTKPPNLVLILADDLGHGDLGCHGSRTIRTPNLDRLAREGVRATDWYTAQPVCSASRAALLTGCYPNRVGIAGALGPNARNGIAAAETTLAELCKARGYATAVFGKWHLGDRPQYLPTRHGFDTWAGLPYSNDMGPWRPGQQGPRPGYPPLPFYIDEQITDAEVSAEEQRGLTQDLTQRAVAFIAANRERPFFLYLPHSMPHVPLGASAAFAGRSGQGLYADVVEEIDASVGAVLQALDTHGVAAQTIVVFTSDNGPWLGYGNHAGSTGGLREGKGTTWEGGVRVPCLWRWPGHLPAGTTCRAPLMAIDVLPTFARFAGLPLPTLPIDGLDASACLMEGAPSPHAALYFYYHDNQLEAVRAGAHKLVLPHTYQALTGTPGRDGAPAGYTQERTGLALYDLEQDPAEAHDLAAARPELLAAMQRHAERARADLGDALTQREGSGRRNREPRLVCAFGQPERVWPGPDLWANPWRDWRVAAGRLECVVSGPDRNVAVLPLELAEPAAGARLAVRLGIAAAAGRGPDAFAGFWLGTKGEVDDPKHVALLGRGLAVGLGADGRLRAGGHRGEVAIPVADAELGCELGTDGGLSVRAGGQELRLTAAEAGNLRGGIALVAHLPGPVVASAPGAWFDDLRVEGAALRAHPARRLGPVLFTQHTLSAGVLKLSAHLPPVPPEQIGEVTLEVEREGRWREIGKAEVDPDAGTACFRIPEWRETKTVPYRVFAAAPDGDGRRVREVFSGSIPADVAGKEFVLAAVSCFGERGFPLPETGRRLLAAAPDLLFCAGDQLYEGNGGFGVARAPLATALVDYRQKWAMFGWAFRELLRVTPSVCLPDDHDVFHGNLWGAGGRAAESRPTQAERQDSGGYTMPARFVRAVERSQTSHLPDPVDPEPVLQGIGVHFTELRYRGASFAIVEDRKFKTAPRQVLPEADVWNGFARAPGFDPRAAAQVAGAELLGARQERFLAQWAQRDRQPAEFRALLSATPLVCVQTLPRGARNDQGVPGLPLLAPGDYAADDLLVADMDSNAWPQRARDRVVEVLRTAGAVHVCGDQHLASVVRYGRGAADDPWAFCVPALSNTWPRRFMPPGAGPTGLGAFADAFGNPFTVVALANPRPPDRAAGHGIVRFAVADGVVTFECWPRSGGSGQYPGWPVRSR